jgi:hypothetical protein
MKHIFILSLLTLTTVIASAQTFNYNDEILWSNNPTLHDVHKPYDSSSAVGILDDRKIEYVNEKDNVVVYEHDHFIVKVMNDNGIESYNKIYVPVYENASVQDIKARTITPSGKIIQLDTNNIKDAEEDNQKYRLFALEGLEKGAEVEYAYTIKRNLFLFGSETFQRTHIPYLHAKFALITPSYLKFDAKGYNGFMVSPDSVINERRIIVGYSNDIDAIEDEKYAQTDPYMQRVDYKLSYNLNKNANVRLYTWKEYAQKTFDYYTTRSQKEDKALTNFVSKIPVQQNAAEAQKILSVEDYLKNYININKDIIGDGADNIESIIKNKASNNDGIVRLFAGIFDKLSVNYQIVFPGTRTGYTIDENLENWNRANDVLFYFPPTGKFISPTAMDLRYPYIPYDYTETRGLFLKGTVIGDFKTAIGSFANIPVEPFDQSALNLEADIHFNDDLDTAIMNVKEIYKGYGAEGYRPIYNFLTPDKQDEANKEIIKENTESENISNVKIENKNFTDFFDNKPLIISADVKGTELIERAGNKILFKIGAVIGPQEQMYQEKPRKLPVELPFPHSLNRTIILNIPDGYSIKNPDDLKMNIGFKENDIITMGFVSSYSIADNIVTITINETYREIKYPLSEFDDFKKVINASADFNKVVLVLEKK